MRCLIVCPVAHGSGEATTAAAVGRSLERRGHDVRYLTTAFGAMILGAPQLQVTCFGDTADGFVVAWDLAVSSCRPQAIVFVDYHNLAWGLHGPRPTDDASWSSRLEECDATLITLDHFGLGRAKRSIFVGPAHLMTAVITSPQVPDRMHVLRPCPMHDPQAQLEGVPFRLWEELPTPSESAASVRQRLGLTSRERLVLHLVPAWAHDLAEAMGVRLFDEWHELLLDWFSLVEDHVALVAVNGRDIFRDSLPPRRVVNLDSCPAPEFDSLLLAADLVISSNGLSLAMGRAACAGKRVAAVRNSKYLSAVLETADDIPRNVALRLEAGRPGSVYPFVSFPNVTPADVAAIGLYQHNRVPECVTWLEAFGGSTTATMVAELLTRGDGDCRRAQDDYVAALHELPCAADLVEQLTS